MQTEVMLLNRHYRDINPLTCGFERCAPGHAFGPASRDYLLLHYVMSGRGVFRTPRGEYAVRRGQLFVIRPLEITTYQADARDPWSYCWAGFACAIPLPVALERDVVDAAHCEHIFAALAGLSGVEAGREYYLCGKLYELFAALSAPAACPAEQGREYVLKAKNYMEARYGDDITVGQMARSLGIDRSYFCRLFKKYAGCSPQQYLVDFRLQKAAELIAVNGYRPGEAAMSAGYRDIVNFSRMFKKRFGVPPSAYSGKESVSPGAQSEATRAR